MQRISVAGLFEPGAPTAAIDRQIAEVARDLGFLLLGDLPDWAAVPARRRRTLTAVFDLPAAEKQRLSRRRHNPQSANLYRGFDPLGRAYRPDSERMDVGPDVVSPARARAGAHPLQEPTPLPREELLPGWSTAAAAYYAAMERLGGALLRALARAFALPEETFAGRFDGGISTLRFIHYRPEAASGAIMAGAHEDTGFTTLLHQDEAGGLELQARDGSWHAVPPAEGQLAVNFGLLFERWTQGRVRATPHRVANPGRPRFSIAFFHEPAFDARIAPLPDATARFEPFDYGPFLWREMQRYRDFDTIEAENAA